MTGPPADGPVAPPCDVADRPGGLPGEAERLARQLLRHDRDRLRHSAGVAARAAELAVLPGIDAGVLVAAAWLHDIGYARPIAVTGFHPLDGARYLSRLGWPAAVVGPVAQHSGARFVAAALGYAEALAACPAPDGNVYDALTYADRTVGPAGEPVTWQQRHAEMVRRHGPDSAVVRVDALRLAHLAAVVARVERRLAEVRAARDDRLGAPA